MSIQYRGRPDPKHKRPARYPCCPRRANPDPATAPPIRTRSGITSIAEVPEDPHSKVLHLCRYPRNAARSAIGTANGAGIGPAVDPGDPLAPVVGHVVDELVFAAGVAAGFPDEEQLQ